MGIFAADFERTNVVADGLLRPVPPGDVLLRRQSCPACGRQFTGMGLGVAAAGGAWLVCGGDCAKAVLRAVADRASRTDSHAFSGGGREPQRNGGDATDLPGGARHDGFGHTGDSASRSGDGSGHRGTEQSAPTTGGGRPPGPR